MVVPSEVVPRNTSYAVTATLSVEAFQRSVKLVWRDRRRAQSPAGTEGACESGTVNAEIIQEQIAGAAALPGPDARRHRACGHGARGRAQRIRRTGNWRIDLGDLTARGVEEIETDAGPGRAAAGLGPDIECERLARGYREAARAIDAALRGANARGPGA